MPAILFRDFDAHQAEFEHLVKKIFAERAGFVHGAHVRADPFASELANRGLEHLLFVGQDSERQRHGGRLGGGGHNGTFSLLIALIC